MTTLTEIEAAIQQLSESDVRQLAIWLHTYLDEVTEGYRALALTMTIMLCSVKLGKYSDLL